MPCYGFTAVVNSSYFIVSDAELSEVLLAVESLLLRSHMVTRNNEPARPDPTMTLVDGLLLDSVRRYEIQSFT